MTTTDVDGSQNRTKLQYRVVGTFLEAKYGGGGTRFLSTINPKCDKYKKNNYVYMWFIYDVFYYALYRVSLNRPKKMETVSLWIELKQKKLTKAV